MILGHKDEMGRLMNWRKEGAQIPYTDLRVSVGDLGSFCIKPSVPASVSTQQEGIIDL